MTSDSTPYAGPKARRVGHRLYDELLKDIIRAVGANVSREDLISLLLERLPPLSHANAIAVLEATSGRTSALPTSAVIKGYDQRGVNPHRWRQFVQTHALSVPQNSLIHRVIEDGLEVDVWSVEHFKSDAQVLRPLFDIDRGGWIAGLQLPRATARHNHQAVFLWYQTGQDASRVAPGSEQDWRFLMLFRECYAMAGYNIRKVARSIIMQRQELLRSLTPGILNHEINARISFFKSGLELSEDSLTSQMKTLNRLNISADDQEDLRDALRKISKQLLPQAARLKAISESVMGLTRRVASGPTDPVHEVKSALELLAHPAGDANVVMEIRHVPDGDVEIVSDPALLMHILVNVVLNAIDALKPVPPSMDSVKQVLIDISRADNAASEFALHVDISDNGPGVTDTFEARIFEPGITTKKHGHGLGLAIGTMIASYLGGRLILLSPRNPTVFRLSLPAQSPKIADLEEELKNSEERP